MLLLLIWGKCFIFCYLADSVTICSQKQKQPIKKKKQKQMKRIFIALATNFKDHT